MARDIAHFPRILKVFLSVEKKNKLNTTELILDRATTKAVNQIAAFEAPEADFVGFFSPSDRVWIPSTLRVLPTASDGFRFESGRSTRRCLGGLRLPGAGHRFVWAGRRASSNLRLGCFVSFYSPSASF